MFLLGSITFLAAFLLFQIELIIAKLFLPGYGGSYLVWGACVVFFQAVLLAGYVAAHHLIVRFGIRKYLNVHIVLLVLPFLFFPGHTIAITDQAGTLPLVLDIFVRLLLSIGPVFFVLSTVSLVTQSWLESSELKASKHPYVLYAVSNIGSFAALWSYPFVFEYFLTNTQQLNIWRFLYLILVILNVICIFKTKPRQMEVKIEEAVAVTRAQALRWLLLSAGAVMLFLSVTNIITYEVAPVPLLWILPLSIYLLSFVLAFKNEPWQPRWMNNYTWIVFVAAVLLYFQVKLAFLPAAWAVIFFSAVLFLLCLFAQNELIRSKPAGNLTFFYVMISLGGFVGGFLTSWVVPLISTSPVEFLLGLSFLVLAYRAGWVRMSLVVLLMVALIVDFTYKKHVSLIKKRNYYGIYDVFEKNDVRSFVHGTTLHGIEWADGRRYIPLGYYSPMSPMGQVFVKDIFEAKRVGAVGLGAGTMAMFSKPDMPMDFYELDPDVQFIARTYFWYLSLAPGPVRIATGDARVSLARGNEVYDVIVIDAFGGDSIPFHLINKDVVELYRSHLGERGGILFHIPNRYFDLEPILANIAKDLGGFAAVKESQQDGITMHTYWAVVTWDVGRFGQLITDGWRPISPGSYKPMRTWSDDYSTVLPVLKFDEVIESLKHFRTKI